MSRWVILPKNSISGNLSVPPSKSVAQRVIALAGLSKNEIVIHNVGENKDVLAALRCIETLGATVEKHENSLFFKSGVSLSTSTSIQLNCGESGLSARLFSAFSLLTPHCFRICGEGSLLKRSMKMVIDGVGQFGKEIVSNNEKIPLIFRGGTNNYSVVIDASESSQFLTGLLLVTPFLEKDSVIEVIDLQSKPYIDLTLSLLQHFGLKVENKEYRAFIVKGNQQVSTNPIYSVEGDWSSATFPIVAASIGGSVVLKGLILDSAQGDKAILEVLKQVGTQFGWVNEELWIEKKELNPFLFDATNCPDLFPPLVVLASFCKGKSFIKGVHRLYNKESNRASALQEECKKIGIKVDIEDNQMIVHGGNPKVEKNTVFDSHNDHRIAMAMGLFSIGAKFPIHIENAEAVEKSYPSFFEDYDKL